MLTYEKLTVKLIPSEKKNSQADQLICISFARTACQGHMTLRRGDTVTGKINAKLERIFRRDRMKEFLDLFNRLGCSRQAISQSIRCSPGQARH